MTGIGWCDSGHFFIITRFLTARLTRQPQVQPHMLSVAIALGTLAVVIPTSGIMWFWFVRSQD